MKRRTKVILGISVVLGAFLVLMVGKPIWERRHGPLTSRTVPEGMPALYFIRDWGSTKKTPYFRLQYGGPPTGETWAKVERVNGKCVIPAGKELRIEIQLRDRSPKAVPPSLLRRLLQKIGVELTPRYRDPLSVLDALGSNGVQELSLQGEKIADEDLAYVGRLTGLRSLRILASSEDSNKITEEGFLHLRNLKRLEEFDVADWRNFPEKALAHIAHLPRLRTLNLRGTAIRNEALGYVKNMARLEGLDLFGTKVTDSELAQISGLRSLRRLVLGGSVKTRYVGSGKSYRRVVVGRVTDLSNEGLSHLAGLTSLEELGLFGTGVDDRGIQYLEKLPSLRRLNLAETRVGESGLKHLGSLRALRHLDLPSEPTDDGLKHLAEHTSLTSLNMLRARISPEGLSALRNMPLLYALTLPYSVSDEGLAQIRDLKSLKYLCINSSAITDAGLAHIGNIASLESLVFRNASLSNKGLAHLGKLTSLRKLEFVSGQIPNEGLTHLCGLPKLESLHFEAIPISTPAVSYIEKMPHLRELGILRTRVTSTGFKRLLTVLPQCTIYGGPDTHYLNK